MKHNFIINCVSFLAGFSAPHTARQDTDFAGYTIPAGSLVLANIFAMHHDKEYWGDPEVFRIDRWIGEDGQFLLHDEYFMPFSIGKSLYITLFADIHIIH